MYVLHNILRANSELLPTEIESVYLRNEDAVL